MFISHPPFGLEEMRQEDHIAAAVPWNHLVNGPAKAYGNVYCPGSLALSGTGSQTTNLDIAKAQQSQRDIITPCDTVPALFSSPSLSNNDLTTDMITDSIPDLPDLVSDADEELTDSAGEIDEVEIQLKRKPGTTYAFLRCGHCDSILKYVFVDEIRDGVHSVHKCHATCICSPKLPGIVEEPLGPVQVSRGAW